MFVTATESDKGFPLSTKDVTAEDKNEQFDLIKAELASTLRSPISSRAVLIDKDL